MGLEDYLAEQLGEDGVEPEVEAPAAEGAEATVEAAEPEGGQSRDEQGRFVSPAADAELLEKRLRDKDEYISRLGNELGELRKAVQQVSERQPDKPPTRYDLSGVDEIIADNPQLAPQLAQAALQQGDSLAYERILRSWGEYDTFGALRFEQQVQSYNLQQQLLAAALPAQEQMQQMAHRQQVEQATLSVARRLPDFRDVIDGLDTDRDDIPLGLLNGIENPATAEGSLEALYYWAKGRNSTVSSQASERASQEYASEQHQQKTVAAVASPVSSPPASEGTDDELESFYRFFKTPSPTSIPYR